MKKIIMLLTAGVMALGFVACNDDEKVNSKITPANDLFMPRNNYQVDLAKNVPVKFEWASSMAEDRGYVVYELLFDKEGGDFSNPLYVVPSSDKGYSPSVEISSTVIATIAMFSGVAPGETAAIKWTVRAWKGRSSVTYSGASGVRTLIVSRPNSVDPLPRSVMVSGTATEAESAIALNPALPISAVKGGHIADREIGAFECFTKLTAGGELAIVDDLKRRFTLVEGGLIQTVETEAVTAISKTGIYWIYMNFNTMSWTMKEITKVELWNGRYFGGDDRTPLNYDGSGVWSLVDYAWNVGTTGQKDTRYHFNVIYADGSIERWAHWNDDCRGSSAPDSDPKFFNIYRFTNAIGDWDHDWKTNENENEGVDKLATFHLYMNNIKAANYLQTRSFKDKN